jgi:hypothetical protein
MAAQSADAGIVYDLRLGGTSAGDSNAHTLPAAPGTYTLDLWMNVSGTDGTVTNETHTFDYVTILSQNAGGGAITTGGLTGALGVGFDETGSRVGGGADLNGDGITDWGSTSTNGANTNYMLARTSVLGGRAGGGTVGNPVGTGWEFKLATFTLNIGATGPGTTSFKISQPAAKATVGTFTYSSSNVDGALYNSNSSNAQGAYTGSQGVTVAAAGPIPEPASIGLLGAAAVGLLGRRRK